MMPTLLGKEVCERATLSCALPLYSFVIIRVGQNRIYAPYMTVYLVIFQPQIPYIHRIYMVLANPSHVCCFVADSCVACYLAVVSA